MGRSSAQNNVTWPVIGTDVAVNANIPAECMRHSFIAETDFGFGYTTAPTAKTAILHTFLGPGTVTGFHGLCAAAGSAASITMDCKKNGASILTAPIAITNATGDGVMVDGVLSGVVTCVKGDIITGVLAESTNTGMAGPRALLAFQETSSPV